MTKLIQLMSILKKDYNQYTITKHKQLHEPTHCK